MGMQTQLEAMGLMRMEWGPQARSSRAEVQDSGWSHGSGEVLGLPVVGLNFVAATPGSTERPSMGKQTAALYLKALFVALHSRSR